MVCLLGHWKMGAVAKLLLVDNCSDITPDEMNDEKIAIQMLRKGFLDADDSNLLEAEDMHIFGYRPMTDPLHLVCCNECKKPVKASQYAAHAERCGSLNSIKDTLNGVEDYLVNKKPPRKGRKVSEIINGCNQNTNIHMQEKGEPVNRNIGGSVSNFENQNTTLVEAQRSIKAAPHATVIRNSLLTPGDYPIPMATKIYHWQGNSRLRFELGHIYRETCIQGQNGNFTSPISIQESGMPDSQFTSLGNPPYRAENNGPPQMKSKSLRTEVQTTTQKGIPNGRYHTTNPYSGDSEQQTNGRVHVI